MFSGAGAAAPKEDDSDSTAAMEKMAKAMGMSLAEYQLGINARMRMEEEINNLRVTGGDASKGVTVERCGNSPPKHLVINITDDGKAMGKAALETELVSALKSASEQSKKGREMAQQKMMQYIGEQMKSM
jgi:DNA-binding protein YbaB